MAHVLVLLVIEIQELLSPSRGVCRPSRSGHDTTHSTIASDSLAILIFMLDGSNQKPRIICESRVRIPSSKTARQQDNNLQVVGGPVSVGGNNVGAVLSLRSSGRALREPNRNNLTLAVAG